MLENKLNLLIPLYTILNRADLLYTNTIRTRALRHARTRAYLTNTKQVNSPDHLELNQYIPTLSIADVCTYTIDSKDGKFKHIYTILYTLSGTSHNADIILQHCKVPRRANIFMQTKTETKNKIRVSYQKHKHNHEE